MVYIFKAKEQQYALLQLLLVTFLKLLLQIETACEVLQISDQYFKALKLRYQVARKLLNHLMDRQWSKEVMKRSSAFGTKKASNSKAEEKSLPLPKREFDSMKGKKTNFLSKCKLS